MRVGVVVSCDLAGILGGLKVHADVRSDVGVRSLIAPLLKTFVM